MKKRLTTEELARSHDGLCGVSVGDGDCSCLVHWVTALQKELDTKELQISEHQEGAAYDRQVRDEFAREMCSDAEGKEWLPGLNLRKLVELIRWEFDRQIKADMREVMKAREEANISNRINGELRELLVEADSHLSYIVHRFNARLSEDFVKDMRQTSDKIRKHTEKRKCVHDGGDIPCDHQKPCEDHKRKDEPSRDWKCAKCGKVSQFKDGLCWDCFGGDPGE